MSAEEAVHGPPDDWADVEALALVEVDQALREHREGELAREEREREGDDRPGAPRRGFVQ